MAGIAALLIGLGAQPEQALSQPSERSSEASAPKTPSKPSFVQDQILVKVKEGASSEAVDSLNRKNNASTKKKIPHTKVSVVKLPKELLVEEAIERYEASSEIEYAEPDFIMKPSLTTNDPSFSKLYGLNNTGQTGGTPDADVDSPEAWDITTGSSSTVVAVIDTGTDIKHPDLKNNIWVNSGETAGNGIDDDKNGYVDDVNGWDFYNNDASVFDAASEDSHGTHVAGTIAAEGNNGIGVVGVNWRAKIMPLKFLGPDGGYTSDAVGALNYAVAKGAKISNNSWGGGGFSKTLYNAIKKADDSGHLFMAAAGNGGADGVGDDNDVTSHYPSSYDLPNVVSVAATNNQDALAGFSNYGSSSVDLAAPGVSISSTLPSNTYGSYSGTSMATPHVTGAAALLKSNDSTLDDAGLKARLLDYADKKTNLSGKMVTESRLNTAQALGVGVPMVDSTTPMVDSTTPASGATGVQRNIDITATFSEEMNPDTLSTSTVKLSVYNKNKRKYVQVTNTAVSCDSPPAPCETVTLDPYGASSTLLGANKKYKVTITTGVKDKANNALAQNKVWTFTTGSA